MGKRHQVIIISILGPVLSNVYNVCEMQSTVSTTNRILQHEGYTLFCDYAKVNKLQCCADIASETLSKMESWSKGNNLALNKIKRNVLLSSGSRLSNLHHLNKSELIGNFFTCNEIVRDKSKKLLARNFGIGIFL